MTKLNEMSFEISLSTEFIKTPIQWSALARTQFEKRMIKKKFTVFLGMVRRSVLD
jgi:hypothetical protein